MLRDDLAGEALFVYCSPYIRTRQTLAGLELGDFITAVYEEPRLREQDFGNLQEYDVMTAAHAERDAFGTFYSASPTASRVPTSSTE